MRLGLCDAVVVGGVLLDDPRTPTRFLAARRSAPPALAGLWEFPGGKLEPGEAPIDEKSLRDAR